MTPTSTASEMLTRMPRSAAITKASYISLMHRSHAKCSAFWADVAAALEVVPAGEPVAVNDDVFSFSPAVLAQMGRKT